MEKVQTWVQAMQVPQNIIPAPPPGLEALYSHCRQIYPNQTNPLQVSALLKYWLGGPDPLDYISMYSNPGNIRENIPPHWHYISFGLSDLHGDGRVHDVKTKDLPSGFGFELTFRLKKEPGETAPPTWPAALMQALSKYVFQSGNLLCAGDHVSWHCALDNSESRIQHMLMMADPQLETVRTLLGTVNFIQIVGVCEEELRCAQRWNGPGVIDILKRLREAGGPWLVTDMRRGESMFDLDPTVQEEVERGIENEGSNLSGVSARCTWIEADSDGLLSDQLGGNIFTDDDSDVDSKRGLGAVKDPILSPESKHFGAGRDNQAFSVTDEERMRIKSELFKGLTSGHSAGNSKNSFVFSSNVAREPAELSRIKCLEGVHLSFNLESGMLLPLAIRGRVMHGRHFTFKSVLSDAAITLVSPSVTGILVDTDRPYVAQGSWLQVLIPDHLADDMSNSFDILSNVDDITLPKTFVWRKHKLAITVLSDENVLGVL